VKRLVAALLGLFIILVVVGLLSKVGLGFLSLAAAILAMALAWLAQYRKRPVPAWRLIPAA
jgi:amino acid permease